MTDRNTPDLPQFVLDELENSQRQLEVQVSKQLHDVNSTVAPGAAARDVVSHVREHDRQIWNALWEYVHGPMFLEEEEQ